jgi:hypothetical protein
LYAGILFQVGKLQFELIEQRATLRGLPELFVPQLLDRELELIDQQRPRLGYVLIIFIATVVALLVPTPKERPPVKERTARRNLPARSPSATIGPNGLLTRKNRMGNLRAQNGGPHLQGKLILADRSSTCTAGKGHWNEGR